MRHIFDEVKALSTEQRNPRSMLMDELPTFEILSLINSEDAKVADAVREEIPYITRVVDELTERFKRGGKLYYAGAGTSGRMGIVDAAECPPTFGSDPSLVTGIMAGGHRAVFHAVEGAEDKRDDGADSMNEHNVGPNDLVIGIAASKRTPFVLGALEEAKNRGAFSVLLTTNPRAEVEFPFLDEKICPVVGPEVLMGSTRMKSAVAQKMVLTMITTTVMIRLGKAYENMMVDLQLTNQKLVERAKRIIMLATGCEYERAAEVLTLCNKHVKTAIIVQLAGVTPDRAKEVLTENDGFVKRALRSLGIEPNTRASL
jgi:N-acetylmuramic acid 6-phosphate etherase